MQRVLAHNKQGSWGFTYLPSQNACEREVLSKNNIGILNYTSLICNWKNHRLSKRVVQTLKHIPEIPGTIGQLTDSLLWAENVVPWFFSHNVYLTKRTLQKSRTKHTAQHLAKKRFVTVPRSSMDSVNWFCLCAVNIPTRPAYVEVLKTTWKYMQTLNMVLTTDNAIINRSLTGILLFSNRVECPPFHFVWK